MTGRRGRRSRVILIVAVAAAAVLLIAGSILWWTSSAGTPTAARTPTASTTSSTPSGAIARACPAGTVTTATVQALRAEKDFTPVGAVEFLTAFLQLTAQATPEPADGALEFSQAASTGAVLENATAALQPGGNAYGDTATHGEVFVGGKYLIEDATSQRVTVSLFGLMVTGGELATNTDGNTIRAGGTYTLEPSTDGWVVTGMSAGTPLDTVEATGVAFSGGC
ncbi:hypothetical protein ACI2IX_20080 [Leifsonia aquatica]|uniref:hypothetical protein n=1 Tax=Leifsonia aquatica TaxID=144185 RepID=UPI003850CD4F